MSLVFKSLQKNWIIHGPAIMLPQNVLHPVFELWGVSYSGLKSTDKEKSGHLKNTQGKTITLL